MKKFTVFLVSLLALVAFSQSASAIPVDLELSLLVDVSGSIDDDQFDLQKSGYVEAFRNNSIWDAISQGAKKSIAVNLIFWAGTCHQDEVVGWSLINSKSSMNDFASSIDAAERKFEGSTGIGAALKFSTKSFKDNNYEGTRKVIDISGDGKGSALPYAYRGRDYAIEKGIDTINGIVIGDKKGLLEYYEDNVIGGINAFAMQADSFEDFGSAIDDKLIREITVAPVPEPATMALLGLGLLGLAGVQRKRRQS